MQEQPSNGEFKVNGAIAREPEPPSKVTRRKHLAFLRRVFSWAARGARVPGAEREGDQVGGDLVERGGARGLEAVAAVREAAEVSRSAEDGRDARVEAVSSHAVAKRLLGHADEDVTDSYLMPTLEDVRAAVNRAARLIDGEASGPVEELHGTNDGTVTRETAWASAAGGAERLA